MKRDKFQQMMDRNLIALWEQTIRSQKEALKYDKKNKNTFMIDLREDSLQRMLKRYEQVKERIIVGQRKLKLLPTLVTV